MTLRDPPAPTRSSRPLPTSPTTTLPSGALAIETGARNPLASVVIVPAGSMRRMLPLCESATTTDPSAPIVRACGAAIAANAAGPPSPPEPSIPVPATVSMIPLVRMRRSHLSYSGR